VDDHQVPLARRLAGSGLVTLVEDELLLAEAIAGAEPGDLVATVGQALPGVAALVDALRSGLDGAGVARAGAA
jgi:hypothetical protein